MRHKLFCHFVICPCSSLIQTLMIPWMTYWMIWIPQWLRKETHWQTECQGRKVTAHMHLLLSPRKRLRSVSSVRHQCYPVVLFLFYLCFVWVWMGPLFFCLKSITSLGSKKTRRVDIWWRGGWPHGCTGIWRSICTKEQDSRPHSKEREVL